MRLASRQKRRPHVAGFGKRGGEGGGVELPPREKRTSRALILFFLRTACLYPVLCVAIAPHCRCRLSWALPGAGSCAGSRPRAAPAWVRGSCGKPALARCRTGCCKRTAMDGCCAESSRASSCLRWLAGRDQKRPQFCALIRGLKNVRSGLCGRLVSRPRSERALPTRAQQAATGSPSSHVPCGSP